MIRRRTPKYRHCKPKNLAMVVIAGHAHYLGRYDSPESWERYHRLLAEHHAAPLPSSNGRGGEAKPGPTIAELMLAYWERHVVAYYVKDGRPTSEQDNIRQALRFLRRLHGTTAAVEFGPSALKAVRQSMIEAGRCRGLINKDVNRIRGMFRWAVEQELVPVAVHQALLTVAGLRKGRSEARERPPVAPVPDDVVKRTLPLLSPTVAAMVRLQRLTGMRPQEVILMRGDDIDRGDPDCWLYRPSRHKNQHGDRERLVYLGPKSQDLLRPFLAIEPSGYLFSPRRAEAERLSEVRARRVSPPRPWQQARLKASPARAPGEIYDGGAYRKAIRRACKKLGLPIWFPHQLRHSAASEFRSRYGLEASQALLGHAELGTTQIYAEVDRAAARRIMAEAG